MREIVNIAQVRDFSESSVTYSNPVTTVVYKPPAPCRCCCRCECCECCERRRYRDCCRCCCHRDCCCDCD